MCIIIQIWICCLWGCGSKTSFNNENFFANDIWNFVIDCCTNYWHLVWWKWRLTLTFIFLFLILTLTAIYISLRTQKTVVNWSWRLLCLCYRSIDCHRVIQTFKCLSYTSFWRSDTGFDWWCCNHSYVPVYNCHWWLQKPDERCINFLSLFSSPVSDWQYNLAIFIFFIKKLCINEPASCRLLQMYQFVSLSRVLLKLWDKWLEVFLYHCAAYRLKYLYQDTLMDI